jgi:hypothetical protein
LEFVSIWTLLDEIFPSISVSSRVFTTDHEGNNENENNGYVVFELNMWEALHRPPLHLLQRASGQIFQDDVNGFLSTSDIFFMTALTFENSFISQRVCISLQEEEKKGSRRLVVGERDPNYLYSALFMHQLMEHEKGRMMLEWKYFTVYLWQ